MEEQVPPLDPTLSFLQQESSELLQHLPTVDLVASFSSSEELLDYLSSDTLPLSSDCTADSRSTARQLLPKIYTGEVRPFLCAYLETRETEDGGCEVKFDVNFGTADFVLRNTPLPCKQSLQVLEIILSYEEGFHANLVLIDHVNHTFELFEPLGYESQAKCGYWDTEYLPSGLRICHCHLSLFQPTDSRRESGTLFWK